MITVNLYYKGTNGNAHHASPMMEQLAKLRDKYDLHMTVERFVSDEYEADKKFIRQ